MQRVFHPFWLAFGITLVVVLVALGVDLRLVVRGGPRWRRRLITAALAALTGLGFVSSITAGEVVTAHASAADNELTDRREWKDFIAVWSEAAQIANGKQGRYPFLNDKTKQWFLDRLKSSEEHCDTLAQAGLLTVAEAGLLKKGLQDLAQRCAGFRSKTMMMATCYLPMRHRPAAESAQRLQARLDLLGKLAQQRTVHTAVLERTLAAIETDLATLMDERNYKYLSPQEKAEALKTRDAAAERVRQIKAKLPDDLTTTKEWGVVTDTWRFCVPFAETGKSTEAQRKQVEARLEAAGKAIAALAAAGKLSAAEAQLLQQESARLRTDIYRNPPTDSRVTCYDMVYIPPARESLERLTQRLPLLEQLVSADKLRLSVVEKLLPALEEDLKTLGREQEINKLPEGERPRARAARQQAEQLLQKLKSRP